MAINFDGKGNIEATTEDGVIAVKLYSLEKQIEEKNKEINRLNNIIKEKDNIINELEKWLIKHIDEYRDMEQDAMFEFGLVLDKLKTLKENNKDV